MMRAWVRLGAIVAVCAGLFLVPAVASAASPWMPFRAADFDLAAGSRCPFPLSGRVLEDRERIRTLATFRTAHRAASGSRARWWSVTSTPTPVPPWCAT